MLNGMDEYDADDGDDEDDEDGDSEDDDDDDDDEDEVVTWIPVRRIQHAGRVDWQALREHQGIQLRQRVPTSVDIRERSQPRVSMSLFHCHQRRIIIIILMISIIATIWSWSAIIIIIIITTIIQFYLYWLLQDKLPELIKVAVTGTVFQFNDIKIS